MKRNFLRKRPPADSLGIRAWALESNGGMSSFCFWLCCVCACCWAGCHVLHSSLHEEAEARLTIRPTMSHLRLPFLSDMFALFFYCACLCVKCHASSLCPCFKPHTLSPGIWHRWMKTPTIA